MNETYFKRASLLILLGTATSYGLRAQAPIPFSMDLAKANQYKTAPNSEVLGKIAEANVSMFHGMPSVQIPLYSLKGDNLSYNLALNYYTGGIKVNEKPTWVGLGWSLDGEAQIVRKVNHIPDEQLLTSFYPFGSGAIRPDRGYYFTSNQLNTTDWLNQNFLDDAVNSTLANSASTLSRVILDGEPDEFLFNFAGYSGSFYRTEKGTWAVKSKQNIDLKIEEELHTVGYNQTSRYFFQTNINPAPSLNPGVASLFTKFTLTTPDGFKYTFGGIETAIEFTKTPIPFEGNIPMINFPKYESEYHTANTWKLTKILAPDGEEINFTYERGKLIYERDRSYAEGVRYNVTGNNHPARLHYNLSASFPVYLKTIETQTSILSFIRSKAVEKNYKRLNILKFGTYMPPYSLSAGNMNGNGLICNSEFLLANLIWGVGVGAGYASTNAASDTVDNHFLLFAQQLDSIKLFDKSSQQFVSGYKLVHSADANIRRTLNEVYQYNFQNNEQSGKYTFEYDDVAGMKGYESRSRDAWGYLADEQDEHQEIGDYGPVDVPQMQFVGGTEPNYFSAFSTKGMLKKIINPFGGSTEFVYQPNYYSAKVKANLSTHTMDLHSFNTNTIGSGSRVAQIIRKDYFGAPPLVTRYDYSLNYPNTGLSSGILNADLIFDEVTTYNCANNTFQLTIFEYSTDMFNEQVSQFKGGIVNYSEVTEIRPDGSYTVNKYSNNNNPQYRDELHAGYANSNIISQKNFRLSSLDVERGNLLNSRMFDANSKLVKETINTYNTDPARKSNFIKAIAHKTVQAGGENYIPIGCEGGGLTNKKRLWAYKIYTYANPLSKTIEKTYSEDGAVAFTQEKNFNYDAYGNLVLETSTTSDGKILSKATKYNSHNDYAATAATGLAALGLKNLGNLGIKNYPVEQLVYTNQQVVPPNTTDLSRILSGTEYVYKSNQPLLDKEYALELATPVEGIYNATNAPGGIKTSKINGSGAWEQDSRFKLQKSYPEYTTQAFANKPKTIVGKETNEAVLWDYSGKYPVASFQNAMAGNVAYTGFEGDYNSGNTEFKNGWQFNGTNFRNPAAKIGKGTILIMPATVKSASNAFISSTISLQNDLKYRLCFWALSGNGLEYYRVYGGNLVQIQPTKVTAGDLSYFETEFTAQGTGAVGLLCYTAAGGATYPAPVDEIALFPVGTMFKSMSYDTHTGQVLSVNDGSGHLQLYEYDAFGRLLRVKDENGHLLTEREYYIQSAY